MHRPSGPAIAVIVPVVVFVLLSVYVLSVGPAFASKSISPATFSAVYAPIHWCVKNNDTIERWYQWYVSGF